MAPAPLIYVFNWYLCFTAISYFGMAYCFYLFKPSLVLWEGFYYAGHWLTIIVIFIAMILPKEVSNLKV